MNRQLLVLICLQVLTGLGIMAYWVLFLGFGFKPVNPPPCYFAFEHSFVAPDALLATILVVGGILLAKGRSLGATISAPGGGALVFLGALDVSYNLLNGMYTQTASQALENLAINMWCIGFGVWMIVTLSRHGR